MENVQKTPEQWFQMLKEPYRSEAIANIQSELIKNYFESIIEALYSSFIWTDTPQNYKYWIDIFNSIEAGETTYLEPEQQNQIEPEKVEVDWKAKFEELHKDYDNLNFTYQNFMKIYEEQDLAYDALADKYSKLEAYNDELTEKINETETKNNQEKVYIHYNSKQIKWLKADTLELALEQSEENKNIYEAVKIGVKKSILVSENS